MGVIGRFLNLRIPTLALLVVWLVAFYRVVTSGWIGQAHTAALGYVRSER